MELITPTAECNPDRLSYEKPYCLNGVPYSKVVPVSECCDDVVRWVNLETGEVFKEEPAGLVEGACAAEIPDSKVCYRGIAQTVYINKYATRFTRASEGATTPQYISRIELNYSPADTFCNLLDFAPNAIQYWTGSAYVDPAVLKSQLQSRGLLALVQGCEPKIDNWAVTIESNELVFRFWSTENDYTAQSFYFRVSFSGNASGSPYGTVLFGSSQDTFSVPETVEISIKSLNGTFYYYEDGVEVTDPARIAEIEALIGTLGPDDIVCCPDCVTEPLNVLTDPQVTPTATGNTDNLNSVFKDLDGNTWIVDSNGDAIIAGSVLELPDGQVCYEFTNAPPPVTQTYAVVECLEFFNGTAGVPYYLTQIRLRSASSGVTLGTINFSPALQVWNGTTRITPAAFITALNNVGYLAAVQAVDPRIDRFDVVQTGNSNRIYAFDNQNLITSGNRVFAHTSDYSLSSTGTPINNTINNGNYTNITSTYTPAGTTVTGYRVVTVNGDTTYYKDDVELTAAADITAAQTAIAGATADNVVDCGSSVTCQAVMETETFTATAGQTTFALINAPSGDVRFSRNGAALADNAATVTGSTVTYVPAANNATALLAGDRIEISYVYNVCTGGAAPTIVDGSETKVTAGTGITVTGAGTTGNPYVISTPTLPNYAQTVYLNNTTPATSTIFDLANPPTTHNAALMADSNNLYVGSNDSLWSYDTSTATYSPIGSTLDNIHVRASIPATPLTANTPRILTNFSNVHSSFPTAWNATTGVFTAPVAGFYAVAGELIVQHSTTWPNSSNFQFDVLKNGALDTRWFAMAQTVTTALLVAAGATTIYLAAGNTLGFRANTTAASSTLGNSAFSYITIDKLN